METTHRRFSVKPNIHITYFHLEIVNKKSPEIAASSEQDITVGFEDTALHQDAAVAEEVSLTLLIQLEQQFGQVAGHFHVCTSASPAETIIMIFIKIQTEKEAVL